VKIIQGDCRQELKKLPKESVQCCVTSPPYWALRDYGVAGQIGLEETPEEYVEILVGIFEEVRRILKKDGTLWLNLGDTYNNSAPGPRDPKRWPKKSKNDHKAPKSILKSLKPKDLVGAPWMVAFALRAAGWYLRQDIIWNKSNPMPESVKDRCTKSHEYVFLFSKSERYFFDHEAIKEPIVYGDHPRNGIPNTTVQAPGQPKQTGFSKVRSEGNKVPSGWDTKKGRHDLEKTGRYKKGNAKTFRGGGSYTKGNSFDNNSKKERDSHGNEENPSGLRNKRSVWTVATTPFSEAHFATYPPKLIEPCILAGSRPGDTILDPFHGSGTTGKVSDEWGREYIGIELNPEYIKISKKRDYQIGMQIKKK